MSSSKRPPCRRRRPPTRNCRNARVGAAFTARDKLRILTEADLATDPGEIGALLTPARRSPKPSRPNPLAAEFGKARQDNARLRLRLERAEAIIKLQKNFGWECQEIRVRPVG